MKIGFFDSGIGGMTVLHETLKFLPNEDYIFYADTLHVPYGEKPKEEVREYIFEAVNFLASQGIKVLVIACNTATSIAVEELRKKYDFPILGMEPAVKPAVQKSDKDGKKVLVLATKLTLKEEKFHHLVDQIDHHHIVDSLPLPGLVEFAEKFEFREEKVAPYLKEKLSSFDLNEYGTIVLGCTHFPYFTNVLKNIVAEETNIISGSIGTAKHLKRILEEKNQTNDGTGNITYFKSGTEVEDKETLTHYQHLMTMLDEM